jgi:DNA helicase-2/ATP-dependent DNA helicase PcrA
MSWLRDQLNAQQRAAVEATEGPLLILAGAGSGKTRVITYRIAYLIEALGVEPESILAVTFTNKAADQMKERVRGLLATGRDLGFGVRGSAGKPRSGCFPVASEAPAVEGSALVPTFDSKPEPRTPNPESRSLPLISTFHSFCVRVLRRHIDRLGYTRDFSIYDEDDQQRVIKAGISELGLSQAFTSARGALSRISHAKNCGLTPQALYEQAADPLAEKLASLYDLYQRKLRQANALDFDDLLLKAVALFDKAAEVCDRYNRRFRYILVDEYQDTNRVQYQLIRQLTRAHHNLCVVGDEDQSIYRWRGADIENILSFEKDYPGTRIIRLEQNYRSTQLILDAATAVVSHNRARKGKILWTTRGAGQRVGLYEAGDADEEAEFVASEVERALATEPDRPLAGRTLPTGSREGGFQIQDSGFKSGLSALPGLAVLYRTNAQSRVLEEAMRRRGLPYRLVGGFGFYARAEIKDALAYARLASNLRDSASFLRIVNTPARGIGAATVSTLETLARERSLSLWETLEQELAGGSGLPPRALRSLASFHGIVRKLASESRSAASMSGFFKSLLERTRYLEVLRQEGTPEAEDRTENLMELVNAAAEAEERGETLSEFLDHASLVSDADDYDERARVTLMTLHNAKGLEFSQVYLVGLEEGLLPHKLSGFEEAAIEEERRLCYVGMTRAQDRLVVSWAESRRFFGFESFEPTKRSRFLGEIPQHHIEYLAPEGSKLPRAPQTAWGRGRRNGARRIWEDALNSVDSVNGFLKQRGWTAPPEKRRWKLGTQVRHPKYGLGTVIEYEGEGADTKLTISFPGYGRKKMVEKYAPLTRAVTTDKSSDL